MRRGLKTSEGWLTVATAAGQLAAAIAGVVPAAWTVAGVSASVGLYALARGLAKLGAGPAGPARRDVVDVLLERAPAPSPRELRIAELRAELAQLEAAA